MDTLGELKFVAVSLRHVESGRPPLPKLKFRIIAANGRNDAEGSESQSARSTRNRSL